MASSEANSSREPRPLWLALVVIAMLLPFVGKAIHIDDPLFVWSARQILLSPLDFYGFDVNWYGVSESMAVINKNPPLIAYYLAALGGMFGFGEVALHFGMMMPAVALAFGVASLARSLGVAGFQAALCAIATPAFAVAATSLMSDVAMLAFGVWGLAFAVRAIDTDELRLAFVGGLLLAAAVLTKYFALAFLPLVIVYALVSRRGARATSCIAAVMFLVIAAFDYAYAALYEIHPLLDVVGYATSRDSPLGASAAHRFAVGLFFLGGCTLGPVLFAAKLWSRRELAVLVFFGGWGAAFCVHRVAPVTEHFDLALQQAVFAWVALHWFALSVREVKQERDAASILLLCWIAGVFVFAAFTNWTTNGRSILPAVPAIGILIARALERRQGVSVSYAAGVLTLSIACAMAVGWGDARLADSARAAADSFAHDRSNVPPDAKVLFQGSWGFQYYMEEHGFEKFEVGVHEMAVGDVMVVPGNNTNLVRVPRGRARESAIEVFEKADWVSILARRRSAGYHASVWGVLPFSFGPSVPARYAVYEFEQPWKLRRRQAPASE